MPIHGAYVTWSNMVYFPISLEMVIPFFASGIPGFPMKFHLMNIAMAMDDYTNDWHSPLTNAIFPWQVVLDCQTQLG